MCKTDLPYVFGADKVHKERDCCGRVHGEVTVRGVESLVTTPQYKLCKKCIQTESLRALYEMLANPRIN